MERLLAKDRIAKELMRRIADGTYPANGHLPTEPELTREFRTSRTPVSRALGELERQGLIVRAQRRGTVVLPPEDRLRATGVAVLRQREFVQSPEETRILRGIHESLVRHNLHFEDIVAEKCTASNARRLMSSYCGAVFLEGIYYEDGAVEMEKARFPYSIANLETSHALSATWVDHSKTTQLAVELLAAFGHRQIAFLSCPPEKYFYGNALNGYRRGLEGMALPFDEHLVVIVENIDPASVLADMRKFAVANPTVTALVAARDYLARGACEAFSELGRVIGRDVSVIGFDNLSWLEGGALLTTFQEPAYELGTIAADMVVERLHSEWRANELREIEAPLIIRRSAGPCPVAAPDYSKTAPPPPLPLMRWRSNFE